LGAGAIALSLLSAPPVAEQQLQLAAKNTVAASSFVLTDVNVLATSKPSPTLGGRSSETDLVRIDYQSPDRLLDEVTSSPGHTVTLLVVGDQRYERAGTGLWTRLPPSSTPQTSNGAAAARQLLSPLRSVAGATSVARRGSTYYFVPAQEASLLQSLFGPGASALSSVRFTALINGEYLGSEQILDDEAGALYAVRFSYSSVGTAPAVELPPPSRTTAGAAGAAGS